MGCGITSTVPVARVFKCGALCRTVAAQYFHSCLAPLTHPSLALSSRFSPRSPPLTLTSRGCLLPCTRTTPTGQEVVYGALRPGQSKVYDSYASHPWVFRCSTTDKRMMAGGRMAHYMEPPPPGDTGLLLSSSARRQAANPEPPRVHITPPPVLQHTVSERDPGAR